MIFLHYIGNSTFKPMGIAQQAIKNKIGLIVILILILANACVKDFRTITIYKVENATDYPVKIHVPKFKERGKHYSVDTVFVIDAQSEIEHYYSIEGRDSNFTPPFGISADSAEVIFHDKTFILNVREDSSPRNILVQNNYSGGKVTNTEYEYRFAITDEDHQKANK